MKVWPTPGPPPQRGIVPDAQGNDHRREVWAMARLVLLPTALSCHNRGIADLGEPARLSHISKMVLSIVKFGGPVLTVGRTVFEMWLGAV